MVVARTQTLVQFTNELLARLDERAARERRNRSEVIRDAVDRYLSDERETEIDRLIVQGYTRQPQTPQDTASAQAAAIRAIAAEPW